MNPIAFELLNRAEKYKRSKEVETFQLLSKAEEMRPGQPNLFLRLVSRLGGLLIDAGQWLEDVAGPAGLPAQMAGE